MQAKYEIGRDLSDTSVEYSFLEDAREYSLTIATCASGVICFLLMLPMAFLKDLSLLRFCGVTTILYFVLVLIIHAGLRLVSEPSPAPQRHAKISKQNAATGDTHVHA